MRRAMRVLTLLLLVLMPGLAGAQSQATTGVIEGTVVDETGGRLPGASVTLTNTGTNFTRELITDADGRFRGLLLPLGVYKLTVRLPGFGSYVQDGITLAVGQTANVPVTLRVSGVQQEVVVTADSPIVETTRSEKSTLIDSASIDSLPNNGRNFLSFMQLTPGVAIVQGPDGDEISVNGQKGISNNIAVDGADFNNPFFGEQRGGQRPAFTFNQDAIREVVVVADGAAPEFGRSGGGFVNVVTKSGTNQTAGSVHLFGKSDSISSKNSAGEKFPFDQEQFGATLGGPLRRNRTFYFLAYDEQRFRQTKQTNPARIEPRIVDFFAALGSPNENGPIERTNDARVLLGKIDQQITPANLLDGPLQLHLEPAGERHLRRRLVGPQRQRARAGFLERRLRVAAVDAVGQHPERVPLPVRARGSPAALQRSGHRRTDAAVSRHGVRLRQQLPVRRAVLPAGRVLRHAPAADQQLLDHQGPPHDQGRRRVQSRDLRPDLHRVRQRPLYLRQHRRIPELRAPGAEVRRVLERHEQRDRIVPGGDDDYGAAAAVPPAGRCRQPVGGGGGHTGHPAARAVAVHPGQMAAEQPPDGAVRPALGSADSARPDHAAERGVLCGLHRQARVSVRRHHPVGQEDVSAPAGPLLGSAGKRQTGGPLQLRPVLRAHPGVEPGELALHQRQPRPVALSRQHVQRIRCDPAGVAEPDPAVGDYEPGSPGRVRVRQGLPEPAHAGPTRSPTSGRWPPTCRRSSASRTRTPTTSPGSSTATTPCSARRGAPASVPAAATASAC